MIETVHELVSQLQLREITAVTGGLFSLGVVWGFLRILIAKTRKSEVVVFLCLCLVSSFGLLILRALYTTFVTSFGDTAGTLFNIAIIVAAIFGLHAQYLMVPPSQRATGRWHWFNAWQYPPSGVMVRIHEITGRITRLWDGAKVDGERRCRQSPGSPKRRKSD